MPFSSGYPLTLSPSSLAHTSRLFHTPLAAHADLCHVDVLAFREQASCFAKASRSGVNQPFQPGRGIRTSSCRCACCSNAAQEYAPSIKSRTSKSRFHMGFTAGVTPDPGRPTRAGASLRKGQPRFGMPDSRAVAVESSAASSTGPTTAAACSLLASSRVAAADRLLPAVPARLAGKFRLSHRASPRERRCSTDRDRSSPACCPVIAARVSRRTRRSSCSIR